MDDLKIYIQDRLKRTKGLDMTKLIDACGISRAQFYKCLKEPWRFDEDALSRIADRMDLSQDEREELRAFKLAAEEYERLDSELESFDSVEQERMFAIVEDIIFGKQRIPTDDRERIFTIFGNSSSGKGNTVYSADELSEELGKNLCQERDGVEYPLISVDLFNSHRDNKIQVVYSLLQSLNRLNPLQRSDFIAVKHYINQAGITAEDRLALYSDWHRLMAFSQYAVDFTDKLSPVFLQNWNGCLIRYHGCDKRERYMVISILAKDDAAVYSFDNENFYEFLKYNFPGLSMEMGSQSLLTNNAVTANALLTDLREKYATIEITFGPCVDHLLPTLYDEKETEILSPESKWEGIEKLVQATGAKDLFDMFGAAQFVSFLFDGFKHRFRSSEKAGVICLMSAAGLKRFAKSGTNVDMELVELYFDNDQIIRQLEYIRDNLEGAGEPGKQHFYLVNSGIVQVDKAILIFEGYRVAMTFNEINYPALYHRALLDEKVSRTFYRYVTESLLSEERRSKADSPIMSYKMAKEFIDGLIKMRRESAS